MQDQICFFPRSIQRTSDNSDLPQLPETFDRLRVCVLPVFQVKMMDTLLEE